jgi:hypothetical protein
MKIKIIIVLSAILLLFVLYFGFWDSNSLYKCYTAPTIAVAEKVFEENRAEIIKGMLNEIGGASIPENTPGFDFDNTNAVSVSLKTKCNNKAYLRIYVNTDSQENQIKTRFKVLLEKIPAEFINV